MNLNEGLTWETLREHLLRKLRMPQNAAFLHGGNPEDAASEQTVQILKAFVGFPQSRTLTGPVTLLRGTDTTPLVLQGARNPFGGWWFPEETLLKILDRFERVPMPERLQKSAVQGHLRASLAVSLDWNELEELWCLQLETGEQLTGLFGRTSEQWVDNRVHRLGRLLGGEEQYFFPIIPPLAVKPYPYRLA